MLTQTLFAFLATQSSIDREIRIELILREQSPGTVMIDIPNQLPFEVPLGFIIDGLSADTAEGQLRAYPSDDGFIVIQLTPSFYLRFRQDQMAEFVATAKEFSDLLMQYALEKLLNRA